MACVIASQQGVAHMAELFPGDDVTLDVYKRQAYRHISYSGSIHFTVNTSTINGIDFCLFTIEDDGKEMIDRKSVV